ncbi:MAG: hypothetical protein M1817_002921 [Caeruleum heppii]|nr:MAG: hypothetical protein M1817_002921 [Caeruleum heppii]
MSLLSSRSVCKLHHVIVVLMIFLASIDAQQAYHTTNTAISLTKDSLTWTTAVSQEIASVKTANELSKKGDYYGGVDDAPPVEPDPTSDIMVLPPKSEREKLWSVGATSLSPEEIASMWDALAAENAAEEAAERGDVELQGREAGRSRRPRPHGHRKTTSYAPLPEQPAPTITGPMQLPPKSERERLWSVGVATFAPGETESMWASLSSKMAADGSIKGRDVAIVDKERRDEQCECFDPSEKCCVAPKPLSSMPNMEQSPFPNRFCVAANATCCGDGSCSPGQMCCANGLGVSGCCPQSSLPFCLTLPSRGPGCYASSTFMAEIGSTARVTMMNTTSTTTLRNSTSSRVAFDPTSAFGLTPTSTSEPTSTTTTSNSPFPPPLPTLPTTSTTGVALCWAKESAALLPCREDATASAPVPTGSGAIDGGSNGSPFQITTGGDSGQVPLSSSAAKGSKLVVWSGGVWVIVTCLTMAVGVALTVW